MNGCTEVMDTMTESFGPIRVDYPYSQILLPHKGCEMSDNLVFKFSTTRKHSKRLFTCSQNCQLYIVFCPYTCAIAFFLNENLCVV